MLILVRGRQSWPRDRRPPMLDPAIVYRIRMVIFDWHALWTNLLEFGTFDHVTISLVEKIVRPIVVYVVLIVALRTVGRRVLAQLNPFDLVVLLMLSNTVQNAVIGNDSSLLGGIIGAAALLGANAVAVRAFYRGSNLEHRLREEDDTYLIRHYEPEHRALQRLHINMGELTARAHERGLRRSRRGRDRGALSERHDLHERRGAERCRAVGRDPP